MRLELLALGTVFMTSTFAGDIYSQGTYFGELVKISYKGEGKHKVFEGYLELPSGEIWKFNTLNGEVVKKLTHFVKVDYIQPEKEEEAFKGATTPFNAVRFSSVKVLKLRKIYKLSRDKVAEFVKQGYTYSHGFRCGRVEKIALTEFKTGWFSKKKAMNISLALTNVFGLPATVNGKPVVWHAIVPSNTSESGFFETFEEGQSEGLYNVLLSNMGKFVCIEYLQREPDPKDPFNYRVIGVYKVTK